MWRQECGIIEMLFTYIAQYQRFSGWTEWKSILEEILSCHETVMRRKVDQFTFAAVNNFDTRESKEDVFISPLKSFYADTDEDLSGSTNCPIFDTSMREGNDRLKNHKCRSWNIRWSPDNTKMNSPGITNSSNLESSDESLSKTVKRELPPSSPEMADSLLMSPDGKLIGFLPGNLQNPPVVPSTIDDPSVSCGSAVSQQDSIEWKDVEPMEASKQDSEGAIQTNLSVTTPFANEASVTGSSIFQDDNIETTEVEADSDMPCIDLFGNQDMSHCESEENSFERRETSSKEDSELNTDDNNASQQFASDNEARQSSGDSFLTENLTSTPDNAEENHNLQATCLSDETTASNTSELKRSSFLNKLNKRKYTKKWEKRSVSPTNPQSADETNKERLPCPYCPRVCSGIACRKMHERIFMGANRYTCKICSKTFISIYNLRRHEKVHSEYKPFKCHLCSRSFVEKAYLITHVRSHNVKKSYKCQTCNKMFKTVPAKNSHERLHKQTRYFKCQFCDKKYLTVKEKKSHERTHLIMTRAFACQYCSKTFKRSACKLRHERSHVGRKPIKK